MKPLLAIRAPRLAPDGSNAIRDWEPAADHLTDDGRDKFKQRQLARIAAAQANASEARDKVKPINCKERKV